MSGGAEDAGGDAVSGDLKLYTVRTEIEAHVYARDAEHARELAHRHAHAITRDDGPMDPMDWDARRTTYLAAGWDDSSSPYWDGPGDAPEVGELLRRDPEYQRQLTRLTLAREQSGDREPISE